MSHETPTVKASLRDRIGTRYAQRLRRDGRLPAVIYGHKIDPVAVSVDAKEALTYLHHGWHVFNLDIDGTTETCLVKDLQFGYLGDDVIHIDFARVDLDEEVTVNVQLIFKGEPAAAKEPGAVLMTELTQLEVRCKVNAIPDEIEVDLSEMEQSFNVSEIKMPAGVVPVDDPEALVAHITFVAEEAEGEEAEVVGEEDEPEVISESKEDEGTKEKDES